MNNMRSPGVGGECSHLSRILTAASALTNLGPSLDGPMHSEPNRGLLTLIESEPADLATKSVDDYSQKEWKRFPEVLMDILSYEPAVDMITWLPTGKAFIITKPYDLSTEVLPKFFMSYRFESFVRKLNSWGFKCIIRGNHAGAFYHEKFLRDKPELCKKMKNQKSTTFMCASKAIMKNNDHRMAASKQRAAPNTLVPLFSLHTAESAKTLGVHCRGTANLTNVSIPLKSTKKAQLVTMTRPSRAGTVMNSRMTTIPGAVMKLPMEDGRNFSLMSAMDPKKMSGRMQREIMPLTRLLSRQSVTSTSFSRTPTGLSSAVCGDLHVKAAFLRHQKLLIKTQESRALLQRSGLMGNLNT